MFYFIHHFLYILLKCLLYFSQLSHCAHIDTWHTPTLFVDWDWLFIDSFVCCSLSAQQTHVLTSQSHSLLLIHAWVHLTTVAATQITHNHLHQQIQIQVVPWRQNDRTGTVMVGIVAAAVAARIWEPKVMSTVMNTDLVIDNSWHLVSFTSFHMFSFFFSLCTTNYLLLLLTNRGESIVDGAREWSTVAGTRGPSEHP